LRLLRGETNEVVICRIHRAWASRVNLAEQVV
jgi:hypothetical protein